MTEIVLAAVVAAIAILSYRLGLRDGMRKDLGIPPEAPVMPRKHREVKDDKVSKLLQNIEAYDGTARGQVKID